MRYVILVLVGFGLSLIACGIFATAGAPVASLDAQFTATFRANTQMGLRDAHTAVRELVRDLIGEFTARYRDQLHRHTSTEPLPR